jgi:hypothetical protein
MFFSIGAQKTNFSYHYKHGNFVINVDAGWKTSYDDNGNLLIYKGYIDNFNLQDKLKEIANQEAPIFYGNFCLIKCFDGGVTIKTDRHRSFPLWYDKEFGLTNLTSLNYTCWTDSYVTIGNNYELIESKFDAIDCISTENITFDELIECVDDILTKKITNFFTINKLPVNVYLSGGIDTMLLYSYIKKLNITHTLIDYSHCDYDYFFLNNHDTLMNFWGYRQFHHWRYPCILVSGAPGDEFTVRSPVTANLMLKFYNSSIPDLLSDPKYDNSMHSKYFADDKLKKTWKQHTQLKFDSLTDAIRYCLNLNLNDWQHWHLGQTLSYTPLRDSRIFNLICCLPSHLLKEQIMNSIVQKTLINKNSPNLLEYLSVYKNKNNHMSNLSKLFKHNR